MHSHALVVAKMGKESRFNPFSHSILKAVLCVKELCQALAKLFTILVI
jgi:hypothetical protein